MTDDAAERFELLYRQHFRAVLRYTLARLEPENAQDAAAETFLIAWRRLADVPGDPAPWLFAVARKVIVSHYRADSRREALRARLETVRAGQADPAEIGEGVVQRTARLNRYRVNLQARPPAAMAPRGRWPRRSRHDRAHPYPAHLGG